MTDEKQNELDCELDAALAKYAAVEPRVGLEVRVLASLRAEQLQVPERVWWRWSAAGALAAVIVVALALAWRSGRPHAPVIAYHYPAPAASVEPSGTRDSSSGSAIPRAPVRRSPPKAEMAANPRLDQFPSPRALSEQEKLLVRYVHEFPEEAVLIAQAQAESEKEIEQLIGNQSAGTNPDQQIKINNKTNRER
jgi:hypothetical protein